jgi:hypothetical protein
MKQARRCGRPNVHNIQAHQAQTFGDRSKWLRSHGPAISADQNRPCRIGRRPMPQRNEPTQVAELRITSVVQDQGGSIGRAVSPIERFNRMSMGALPAA